MSRTRGGHDAAAASVQGNQARPHESCRTDGHLLKIAPDTGFGRPSADHHPVGRGPAERLGGVDLSARVGGTTNSPGVVAWAMYE